MGCIFMVKPTPNVKIALLSWLAFVVTFCAVFGLVIAWPWLRGASEENAGHVMMSITGALMFTAAAVGLAVRDYVLRRLNGQTDDFKKPDVARTGCLLAALPASFVAFFCTCAPLGLLASAESSVRPLEQSWYHELWIVAWVLGVLSVMMVRNAKRRSERDVDE